MAVITHSLGNKRCLEYSPITPSRPTRTISFNLLSCDLLSMPTATSVPYCLPSCAVTVSSTWVRCALPSTWSADSGHTTIRSCPPSRLLSRTKVSTSCAWVGPRTHPIERGVISLMGEDRESGAGIQASVENARTETAATLEARVMDELMPRVTTALVTGGSACSTSSSRTMSGVGARAVTVGSTAPEYAAALRPTWTSAYDTVPRTMSTPVGPATRTSKAAGGHSTSGLGIPCCQLSLGYKPLNSRIVPKATIPPTPTTPQPTRGQSSWLPAIPQTKPGATTAL